jgi:hypothetical protein
MTTIEDQVERLQQEVYEYLTDTSIENYDLYEVNEDENGEKNMKQLILGYDNFDEFYTDKFLEKITNDFVNNPCFDVADKIDLDIISVRLMSYMIKYIHTKNSDEYGDDNRLTDYSVENILRLYTYWYARGFGSDEAEDRFQEYYDNKNDPYVLR